MFFIIIVYTNYTGLFLASEYPISQLGTSPVRVLFPDHSIITRKLSYPALDEATVCEEKRLSSLRARNVNNFPFHYNKILIW